jgi:hypothetical protein
VPSFRRAHGFGSADHAAVERPGFDPGLPAVLDRTRPDAHGRHAEHRAERLPALDADVLAALNPRREALIRQDALEGVRSLGGALENLCRVVGAKERRRRRRGDGQLV